MSTGGEDINLYTSRPKIQRQGLKPQSFASVASKYFLHKMTSFYSIVIEKEVEGRKMKIGFCREGNKHIIHDAFGKGRFSGGNLMNLPDLLKESEYVKSSPKSKTRKDKISRFHYFKVKVGGGDVYLNVGEETNKKGKVTRRYVYSATDKIRATK